VAVGFLIGGAKSYARSNYRALKKPGTFNDSWFHELLAIGSPWMLFLFLAFGSASFMLCLLRTIQNAKHKRNSF
jgi:hypothetical protein